jgi:hypothetical protein
MKLGKYNIDNSTAVIISFSLFHILVHLYTNIFEGYGIFRDEYYYIACSKRPDLGYVDHPPFSVYMLMIVRFLFGENMFAIRLLPALASGLLVYMTGALTRKAGGGIYAVLISCITITATPLFWGIFSFYSMNFYEYFVWLGTAYILLLLSEKQQPKLWIWLGIILGLGLLNKISVLWLGAGIFFALVFTPLRSSFKTKWPYITALIAVILFLPYIIWNFTHNFAHIEFMQNAAGLKYSGITRFDFIMSIIMGLSPFLLLIWVPGIIYYFFNREGKNYLSLGILFLTSFLILLINGHSKYEYLGPAFPLLYIGGGILLEKLIQKKNRVFIKYASPVFVLLTGIMLAPLGMPVLPVETIIPYSAAFNSAEKNNAEKKELAGLPQFYADMHGWEEIAQTVSRVYRSLPEDEKKTTLVYANNYGEAASSEYYSSKYEIPPVICGHNSYWFWGRELLDGITTVIIIGGDAESHKEVFEEVTEAARAISRYAMPYENNLPVYVCRKLKQPLNTVWEKVRFYI